MYDSKWDFELTQNQPGVKFGRQEKLAFALVFFSLTFVLAGVALILLNAFNGVQAAVWAVSALLVVGCAAWGCCRLLPGDCPIESADPVQTPRSFQTKLFIGRPFP